MKNNKRYFNFMCDYYYLWRASGYVYQITKNPIQHQLQQSKQDAYLKVMKEATSFKTYKENDIKNYLKA